MTMDKLPSKYIGLYIEQLKQGGLRVPFSSFFLVVIRHFGVHVSQLVPMGVNRGHWFSFENKIGQGTRKCFKEVTTSLKGWKRKFFLIDRRAILDAMPWRHGDTHLHDNFLTNFSENEVDRRSEFLVPLWPPPRHLLYVCRLTMACRHPELQYNIKDQDKNVINMDTFLKLPTWTRTVVSKGDPLPESQRPKPRVTLPLPEGSKIPELTAFQKSMEKASPKITAAREKKEQQGIARAEARRTKAGEGEDAGGPRKKQKVQKHPGPNPSDYLVKVVFSLSFKIFC
ncbi:hypothetical protein Tco_1423802 [Tanacetum coccineum]